MLRFFVLFSQSYFSFDKSTGIYFALQHELNILIALGIQQTRRSSLWPQGAYRQSTHIAEGNVR